MTSTFSIHDPSASTQDSANTAVSGGQAGPFRRIASSLVEETSFSRLLSGKLATPHTPRTKIIDDRAPESPTNSTTENTHDADSVRRSAGEMRPPGSSNNPGGPTDPSSTQVLEPEPEVPGSLLGTMTPWTSMAGLIPLAETGIGGSLVTAGLNAPEGIAPAMVARWGGEIAAGYTVKSGLQTLTLNLEPAHLGRVEVRLQVRADQLSVRLLAANPEAESALKDNLKDLSEAIQSRTGRFQQVDVRVELRENEELDQDPQEKERGGWQDRGSEGEKNRDPGSDHNPDSSDIEPQGQGG